VAELTDTALASRQRVDKAIDAVGPELACVLIDVCCFLKGLEQVEMERGWPVRSAKIVLMTVLGVLHRHYHLESRGSGPAARSCCIGGRRITGRRSTAPEPSVSGENRNRFSQSTLRKFKVSQRPLRGRRGSGEDAAVGRSCLTLRFLQH
jgi:Domain of unknown function (DUF6456)